MMAMADLGIGDWGLGIGPNPQSPNPQSPIPNPQILINLKLLKERLRIIYFKKFLLILELKK
jgi:hypothetical protein